MTQAGAPVQRGPSRVKALASRKMGDLGSRTLEIYPMARRGWSLHQGIYMRRDLMARLGGG